MERSESLKEFAPAFVAAQTLIKKALKDSENPHFKSSYADLASVMDACKDALNNNGIAVIQTTAKAEVQNCVALDTTLFHKSTEWISSRIEIPYARADAQNFGSALTYARRYSLASMVGVCPDDDDAEGAQGRGDGQKPTAQKQQPQGQQRPAATAAKQRTATKIETADTESISELKALIAEANIDPTTVKKWLAAATVKAGKPVSTLEEMPADFVSLCIKHCQNKHQPAPVA